MSMRPGRRREGGQILVIFVGGLIALFLGVAVVVDGGNAMAQQRDTQNAADSASEAGDKFDELRERLRAALADGKVSLSRLKEQATRQAQKADECIRTHPYQAIGIAAGVGVLIGFLFARSQR